MLQSFDDVIVTQASDAFDINTTTTLLRRRGCCRYAVCSSWRGRQTGGRNACCGPAEWEGTVLARLVGSAQHHSTAAKNQLLQAQPSSCCHRTHTRVKALVRLAHSARVLARLVHFWRFVCYSPRRLVFTSADAGCNLHAGLCKHALASNNTRPAGLRPWLLLAGRLCRLCRLLARRPKLRQLSLPLLRLLCPLALQRRRSERG